MQMPFGSNPAAGPHLMFLLAMRLRNGTFVDGGSRTLSPAAEGGGTALKSYLCDFLAASGWPLGVKRDAGLSEATVV